MPKVSQDTHKAFTELPVVDISLLFSTLVFYNKNIRERERERERERKRERENESDPHLLRSEEHTSELQSRGLISYAVFCLKKKKINKKKKKKKERKKKKKNTNT